MISKNQIKQVTALHLKKIREEQKLFIAEGIKIVEEILMYQPGLIKELFATNDFILRYSDLLTGKKINYNVITESELKKISIQSSPNGVLAVCSYFNYQITTFDFSKRFSIYLDDIRDPGNLGTILRMADWFGMNEIFCSPNSTEVYNSKTIQAAMGAFLRVKVNYVELKEVLSKKAIPVYGAVMNGQSIYRETLKNGLIVIGNESKGIREINLPLITNPITIPAASSNQTESLNAAIATSIICAEFFRQNVSDK
jgi:TrmH family RNA methyltransferase